MEKDQVYALSLITISLILCQWICPIIPYYEMSFTTNWIPLILIFVPGQ